MPAKRDIQRASSKVQRWSLVNSSVPPWDSRPPETVYRYESTWSNDLLVSHNHRSRLERLGEDNVDVGGDFHVIKREYTGDSGKIYRLCASHDWALKPRDPRQIGPMFAKYGEFGNNQFPSDSSSDWAALDAYGATAIARVKPDNPRFSFAQAIGEAREGIPSIPALGAMRDKAFSLRQGGNEHLNLEFGWKPLINDIQTAVDTVYNAEKYWMEFKANSGKLLKRRYRWPTTDTTSITTDIGSTIQPVPKPPASCYRGATGGRLTTRTRVRTERWFEGVFTYPSIPLERDDWYSRARYLYGIRFTPDVLWELQPWSWLADWVTNTGEVLQNVTSFLLDELVMPYGYVMEKTISEVTYDLEMPPLTWWTYPHAIEKADFHQRFTTTVKKRRKATPFGFGLDFDGFNDRQLGILLALGISRT